jgi:hypothetical protein
MNTRRERGTGMEKQRKPYTTPRLQVHGGVATLTQQGEGKGLGGGDGASHRGPVLS